MKKIALITLISLAVGIFAGFILWGFQLLPKTTWRWSFGEPIEMSGNIAAPMMIRLPSGTYYYVLDYTVKDGVWYLHDYRIHGDGSFWSEPTHTPLTLGMSNSYEVFMLPPDRYSEIWGFEGYIPDTLQLKYISRQGWFVSDNYTLTRLSVWIADHELSYSDIEAEIEELSWRIGDLARRMDVMQELLESGK